MKFFHLPVVYAHCDIPCKIYDPHNAQMAAHSVIRMIDMIEELKKEDDSPEAKKVYVHQLVRLTKVKEDHAEIVKHEVRVIWGDYFKEEQIKANPDIHELVHSIMMLASKARQTLDRKAAEELLVKVQEFAEIFFKTKGARTIRIPSLYPTGGELVVQAPAK